MRSSVLILSAVLLVAGCGTSRQAATVSDERSGFLGEAYANLQPGDPAQNQPIEVYLPEGNDWASYDKIIVDPVQIWGTGSASNLSQEDKEALAGYLHQALVEELGQDLTVVEEAGPNTLRFGAALTDSEAANQTMTAVSAVLPPAILLSNTYEYIADSPSWQGQAAAEFKMTDAQSGDLLVAAVDRRMGGRTLSSAESSWADVEAIMDYWAELTRFRICEMQGRSGCVKPTTGGV